MVAKKPRILLACVRQAYPRLFAILSGHELEFVSTLTDARAALKGDSFDMIMIGVHFDESRMFELLQQVRADGRYARVPVVCFRGIPAASAEDSLAPEPIEAACKAMGASAFLDMTAFSDDAIGNAAIRSTLGRVLEGRPDGGA